MTTTTIMAAAKSSITITDRTLSVALIARVVASRLLRT
jgi:hypothetical protein